MKSINDDITKFIRERQAAGERKYGKTIERDDMRPSQWANHALEEMADGVQYAARCVETVERLEQAANLAVYELTYQIAKLPDGEEKERMVASVRRLVIALEGGEKKPASLPWHEAPEWAMWAAMDEDGGWFWYDAEPSANPMTDGISGWKNEGRQVCWFFGPECENPNATWTQSKQRRPE
jgi:hypothetical protein